MHNLLWPFFTLVNPVFLFPHKWISASSWRLRGLTLQCRQDELIHDLRKQFVHNSGVKYILHAGCRLVLGARSRPLSHWLDVSWKHLFFLTHPQTHTFGASAWVRLVSFFFKCVFESWQKHQMQTNWCFLSIRCRQCSGSLLSSVWCVWLQQRVCKHRMMLHYVQKLILARVPSHTYLRELIWLPGV